MNDWMRLLNLQEEVRQKDEEIERLRTLCTRAADALEAKQWNQVGKQDLQLIDELRKAGSE